MKKISIAAFLTAVMAGVIGFGFSDSALAAVMKTFEPLTVVNQSSENAISIMQNATVSGSRSSGGALFVNNTGNGNTGLTVYTDAGAAASQPLMRLEVDNEQWQEEVLYIHSDSPTSRGLIRLDSPAPEIEFVETDQPGAAGKFELRVQHDTFQINSRRGDDTTFENKINMTHDGDLRFRDGAVKVESGEQSEFKGGLNVTGGCIAVDGECIMTSDGVSKTKTQSADTQSSGSSVSGGGSIELSDGAPRSLDCNSYTERGALALDHKNNRLYVCNGPERGWDYSTLSD